MRNQNQIKSSLFFILVSLTILFILAQVSFFIVHYSVTDLFDTLIRNAAATKILNKVILLPMLIYVMLQIFAYGVIVAWLWFITISISYWLKFSFFTTYIFGVFCWVLAVAAILGFNSEYYPHSFFAIFPTQLNFLIVALLLFFTFIAYIPYFYYKKFRVLGSFFLGVGFLVLLGFYFDNIGFPIKHNQTNQKPNIILIGLDSFRPDFTRFYGNSIIHTPNVDAFLQSSTSFTYAYTPLARTYPSWVSILTARYPLHNHARVNLMDPTSTLLLPTLPKRLKEIGYQTIYATDENRFSNINQEYGFDYVIGPGMGINDFILGNLSDFPLNNLLLKVPFAYVLFPYQYANRAAAATYYPEHFLHLLQSRLYKRSDQPLFIAIHLCLTHWPYFWGNDGKYNQNNSLQNYQNSIEKMDVLFGKLMRILKDEGLLQHTMVFVLSDHGTTLGMPDDRLIDKKYYTGKKERLNLLSVNKLSSSNQYTLNTSYGQGTDVLSLKQYHTLLAFRGYGIGFPVKRIENVASLLDITPTILEYLKLKPIEDSDGVSLFHPMINRALFFETADHFSEIETDDIKVNQVLKKRIQFYQINHSNGLIFVNNASAERIIRSKQRAILLDDWLLAYYPMQLKTILKPINKNQLGLKLQQDPPFLVFINTKARTWTIHLLTDENTNAPFPILLRELYAFYASEIECYQ